MSEQQARQPAGVELKPVNGKAADGTFAMVREFLRNPKNTAAIAPSSAKLMEVMLEGLDLKAMRHVVEFGPGTGAITRGIVDRLPRGWHKAGGGTGTFVAIEFNDQLARLTQEKFADAVVVNDSAEHLEPICAGQGVKPGELDVVISGLGWANMDPDLCTRVLEATARMLRPGAEFRTFGYHTGAFLPRAKHFKREIERLFGSVRTTRTVWSNLPPAFVYVCTKKR